MKLYSVVGSPNCRKVAAVIQHLGLNVEYVYLDFLKGDMRSPAYLAINPNGMVPTLEDGDTVLWESNAIIQYLADGVPNNTLLPRERAARADVLRWQCWGLAHFNKAIAVLAYETILKPKLMKQDTNPEIVNWAQKDLRRFAAVLESTLEGKRYLVGNTITLADYSIAHQEGFQKAIPFDWTSYPNVDAYFARMRDNPYWAATAPASFEDIGKTPS